MATRVLVANRGEAALRVLRAAAALGWSTVAVVGEDDLDSLHALRADTVINLSGRGSRPYLDAGQLVAAGTSAGCDVVHPGWGFLAESASFARRCHQAGLAFAGPSPEVLGALGDKVAVATGATLADLGWPERRGDGHRARPEPRGCSIEVRLNAERLSPDGSVRPATGTVTAFEPPGGAGIRVDTHGYRGYRPHPDFDSILANSTWASSTATWRSCWPPAPLPSDSGSRTRTRTRPGNPPPVPASSATWLRRLTAPPWWWPRRWRGRWWS